MKMLLIDDDLPALGRMETCCRDVLGPALASVTAVESVDAALARLGSASFDALLLDPRLEHGRGLELLTPRNAGLLPTIIVTADTALAVRAYECGVVDFVPKPVAPGRLELALRRLGRGRETAAPARPFLAVRRPGRVDLVAIDDLVYVEGADKYSELVRADGRRDLHDKGLARLEAALPPSFVRIHKSFLVRFALVSRLHVLRGSRYFAELKTGQRLPVGRSRYEQLKARLI